MGKLQTAVLLEDKHSAALIAVEKKKNSRGKSMVRLINEISMQGFQTVLMLDFSSGVDVTQ